MTDKEDLALRWSIYDFYWKQALRDEFGGSVEVIATLVDVLRDEHVRERELSWVTMPRRQRTAVYRAVAGRFLKYDPEVTTEDCEAFANIFMWRDDLYEALAKLPQKRSRSTPRSRFARARELGRFDHDIQDDEGPDAKTNESTSQRPGLRA